MIKRKIRLSRRLRARQTPSEAKMWALIRSKRLQGYKFYRQFPIGPYITDFCCRSKHVIIEIDGGGHAFPGKIRRDRLRDDFLRQRGFRVIHIWSTDIMKNIDGAIEAILLALGKR